jgi:hypothetical protein
VSDAGRPVIRRLDTRHLARHARKAIRERLGYPAPDALLAVERDGKSVILRLNSGGNAIAVETRLRERGYLAEDAGGNPGGYGCAVRVTAATPGQEANGG